MRVYAFAGISFQGVSNGAKKAKGLSVSGPTPMEIGNTNIFNQARLKQHLQNIRNNACYKCHKADCRSWKHHIESNAIQASVSNIEAAWASEDHADSVHSDNSEN